MRCLVLVLVTMAACTTSEPYRLDGKAVETIPGQGVHLGHVEIDDQGELQSFEQLQAVTRDLKKETRLSSHLVILFVHGWNNNANEGAGGGNLRSFRAALERLAAAQKNLGGRKPYGVFVSWRGRTLSPGPMLFDYFHRYSGAGRAGGIAGTEVIHEISAAARSANSGNRVLMVGHSFGGLLLESAIAEAMTARLAQAHGAITVGQKVQIKPSDLPADLVVMLNAAEAALSSRQLIAAMTNRGVVASTNAKASPWMVSLTSQQDRATGGAFPVSNFLGRWVPPFNFFNTSVSGSYKKGTQSHNGVEWRAQEAAKSNTIGHFIPLHSHEPLPAACAQSALPDLAAVINANLKPWDGRQIRVRGKECSYQFAERDPARYNHSPFWIMQAPNQLIEGHNGIWSDDCVGLLTALMNLRDKSPLPAAQETPAVEKPRVQLQLQSFQ